VLLVEGLGRTPDGPQALRALSELLGLPVIEQGRMSDPVVDDLFALQSKEMNEAKRIQLVKQMSRRVLEKAWRIQGLWTTRLEVRTARLRNYAPMPSHWNNRRFEDAWLVDK
jgi:hypothetical protein